MIAVAAVAVAVMVAAVAVVHITHFGSMPLCTPAGWGNLLLSLFLGAPYGFQFPLLC